MWIFTTFGFYSVVRKDGDQDLTVRARVAADLDALRERYLPGLGPTVAHGGSDYPYRARVSRDAFAAALGAIGHDLAYSNFKNAVANQAGHERAHVYHKVWAALTDLEAAAGKPLRDDPPVRKPLRPGAPAPATSSPLKPSYGGVIFDDEGRVLLREPKGHFDGYVWTFAKGRPNAGETPRDCALREVLEETGVSARIECRIPGVFDGGTTRNQYFLMTVVKQSSAPLDETQSVRWASLDEAREWIGRTTNAAGRRRDLAVLDAAVQVRNRQRPG